MALTRRHLKPSPEAYIKDYERRFGKADLAPAQYVMPRYSALLTSLIRGSAASIRLR